MRTVSATLLWDEDTFKGLLIDEKMFWITTRALYIYNPYTNYADIDFEIAKLHTKDLSRFEEYLNRRLKILGIYDIKINYYSPQSLDYSGWIELTFKAAANTKIYPVESVSLYGPIRNRIISFTSSGTCYYVAHDRWRKFLPIRIANGIPYILNRKLAATVEFYYTYGKGTALSNGATILFPVTAISYCNSELYVIPNLYVSNVILQVKNGQSYKWVKVRQY